MPSTLLNSEAIEEWEERVRKLKKQIALLQQEIEERKNTFPFTYKEKLYDKELMSALQEELRERIVNLERGKERLMKIVEKMKGKKHGKQHH